MAFNADADSFGAQLHGSPAIDRGGDRSIKPRQSAANMATRQARLDAFPSDAERPADQVFEILCEDHVGTYALPFLCHWRDDGWWSAESGERIDAKVIGWRKSQGS